MSDLSIARKFFVPYLRSLYIGLASNYTFWFYFLSAIDSSIFRISSISSQQNFYKKFMIDNLKSFSTY